MRSEDFWELILTAPLGRIMDEYPIGRDFFLNLRLSGLDRSLPLAQALERSSAEALLDFGLDRDMILREFCLFLETFGWAREQKVALRSLSLLGGHDKSGNPEIQEWKASLGEIVSIVGPTGAGKSRLLADIECLADGDTPTGRKVLVNGRRLDDEERCGLEGRLVAQVSQNMNFVMDLSVREFLEMHAESRQALDVGKTVARCFACANDLAGEKFFLDTKVTQLSGGQSRALMIADTAHMSVSPVVLIDEIENAGIDRRRAVNLLARKDKVVFISTHDPLLALSADKRIVIHNGGVSSIITTTAEERDCLGTLETLDATLSRLRTHLRLGRLISRELMKGQDTDACGTSSTS